MARLRARAHAVTLGAFAFVVGGAGCTFVFGWKDLQHDGAPTGDASAVPDGEDPVDASIAGDAGDARDATSDAPKMVLCGTTQCGPFEGCCYDRGTFACSDASACRPVDGGYLACVVAADCAQYADNQACCVRTTPSTYCQRATVRCGTGESHTCDPTSDAACPSPASATGFDTCAQVENTGVYRCYPIR